LERIDLASTGEHIESNGDTGAGCIKPQSPRTQGLEATGSEAKVLNSPCRKVNPLRPKMTLLTRPMQEAQLTTHQPTAIQVLGPWHRDHGELALPESIPGQQRVTHEPASTPECNDMPSANDT